MFEVSGIYGIKFLVGGQIIRNKSAFKQFLNSEEGVMRFLDEMQPFASVTIKNLDTNENMTEYFTGPKEV